MATLARDKMRKYRTKLRTQGLRPVQLWLPDTRAPAFRAEARRQSVLVSRRAKTEAEVLDFMEAAFDWDDWK